MLTAVLIANALVALVCFYATWRVLKLRRTLARVADVLLDVERNTRYILHNAPDFILSGQMGTRQFRHQYRQLELQMRRVRKVLALVYFGKRIWQRRRMKEVSRLQSSLKEL
ncbi:hypothetical protein IQ235_17395 [Oscillatoriales cyanobacterium LEGE 11467]|uniref:Uncharacterized protein n=1 Tax=Zarconia navalis LEGE 11467 TaxID=1828826 RepID=A0A928ZAC0_9CYAN|nr:hypothetical protein [Zarconia navalis]MBE9042548.1 hypothetical protein [Zarconia navalis LEGE 11467]